MRTILAKGFAQARVHNFNSTRAFGTCAIDSMHLCLSKVLSQKCLHAEIRHCIPRDRLYLSYQRQFEITGPLLKLNEITVNLCLCHWCAQAGDCCTDLALEIEKEFDLCFPQVESTYFYFPRLERNATRNLP